MKFIIGQNKIRLFQIFYNVLIATWLAAVTVLDEAA